MTSQPVLPQSQPVRSKDVRWAWICTALIPVGLVAIALCRPLLDPDPTPEERGFDLPGAFLITASAGLLMVSSFSYPSFKQFDIDKRIKRS